MLQQLHDVQALAQWLAPRCAGSLRTDHRQLRAGDALLAWPGRRHDAREHVLQALDQGAAACVVEAEGVQRFALDDARIAAFEGLRRHAGELAGLVLGQPSAALQVVAVTGTNGKTSCAWWVAQALSALGRRCGVIGTLGAGEPGPGAAGALDSANGAALEPTDLTTPDAVALQTQLRRLADAGVGAVAIEASSIGIEEHRLAGVRIAVAAFTNFSRDHLDYHGSMAAYWAAKRRLFDMPGLGCAVVNVDDPCGLSLAQELQAQARSAGGLRLWRVSAREDSAAELRAERVRHEAAGLSLVLREGETSVELRTGLIGEFNVHNLLVVAGCLRALGHGLQDVGAALARLQPVAGRMQRVHGGPGAAPQVVVDYAHTPDALEKVLRSLRELAAARGGRLWCVFGCGGNRDATKRALMGDVAARLAHQVVVSSDNPRDEDPAAIIEQVLAGMPPQARAQAIALPDRREAILHAVANAQDEDLVLIAGKGHERTQEIAGVKRPFDDALEARAALEARLQEASA